MTEKRKPTLADAFINHRYTMHDRFRVKIPLKTIGDLQLKTMKAAKYVFDDQASMRVGEVIRDIPDLLLREARFARAPYDLTWIEWNSSLLWKTIYANQPDNLAKADPDHAERLAMIIDGSDAYCVAGGTAAQPNRLDMCYVTPFRYQLNCEPEMWSKIWGETGLGSKDLRLHEILSNFFWGSTADDFPDGTLYDISQSFVFFPLLENYNTLGGQTFRTVMQECTGDLRTMIAILLMLNRPSITQYKQTLPNTRGFLRNKVVAFTSHTSVTVSLDPQPILKLIGTSSESEVTKRWHRVEGHYCHNKDARDYLRIAGCIHDWVDTDSDWIPLAGDYAKSEVNHWVCHTCEGKRWWREYPHGRGDKTKGIVVKDQYNVTR